MLNKLNKQGLSKRTNCFNVKRLMYEYEHFYDYIFLCKNGLIVRYGLTMSCVECLARYSLT